MLARKALLPLLASLMLATNAQAAWPERPVTFVIPFAAGGLTDVLARLTAERLQARLGQPFVVENAAGAAGTIAAQRVVRAEPDGYTLLYGAAAQFTTTPFTHTTSYDSIKDFAPISIVATSPFVITIGKQVPAATMPEFIAYAKSKPGQIAYGSAGAGSSTHLAAALFAKSAGLELNHVPYKGVGPAFQDLIAGHIAMMCPSPVELRPFLEKGDVKPLAVTDDKRTPLVPGVPAVTEFVASPPVITWNGILAPAKAPQVVIDTLSREIMAANQDPAFRDRLVKLGVDPVVHTPAAFAKLLLEDYERWRVIVRDLGLRVQQ